MIDQIKFYGLIVLALLVVGFCVGREVYILELEKDNINLTKQIDDLHVLVNKSNTNVQLLKDQSNARLKKIISLESIVAQKIVKSNEEVSTLKAIEFPKDCELGRGLAIDLMPKITSGYAGG